MSQTEVQLIKNGAVVDADINGMSSSKLSGALPAISGASLTNLPTPIGKTRNLIINGAAQVAQRGTSAVALTGYQSVDRYQLDFGGGTDENPSQEQGTVAAGTTPYTEGFRKTVKITNGNQTTSPASNTDLYFQILYKLEGQDIANSGWNYLSSSSNITLSFWVKSSVAQEFYFRLQTSDGNSYNYPMSTGSLSADTWTKVTKTIPGNSNLTFDNDNGQSLNIEWVIYRGTGKTGSAATLNTWKVYDSSQRVPDVATSFYTTNNATFEITGVQLEVGSVATDFEHRSFGQELALCERYCQVIAEGANRYFATSFAYNTSLAIGCFTFKTKMRSQPSMVQTTGTNYYFLAQAGTIHHFTQFEALSHVGKDQSGIYPEQSAISVTAGQAGGISTVNASAKLLLTAEL